MHKSSASYRAWRTSHQNSLALLSQEYLPLHTPRRADESSPHSITILLSNCLAHKLIFHFLCNSIYLVCLFLCLCELVIQSIVFVGGWRGNSRLVVRRSSTIPCQWSTRCSPNNAVSLDRYWSVSRNRKIERVMMLQFARVDSMLWSFSWMLRSSHK